MRLQGGGMERALGGKTAPLRRLRHHLPRETGVGTTRYARRRPKPIASAPRPKIDSIAGSGTAAERAN